MNLRTATDKEPDSQRFAKEVQLYTTAIKCLHLEQGIEMDEELKKDLHSFLLGSREIVASFPLNVLSLRGNWESFH